MRLIDADALIEKLRAGYCAECELRDDALCDGCRINTAINGFNHALTIDAIPVEWLKDKKVMLSFDHGMLVNWLIREWQKEQEAG